MCTIYVEAKKNQDLYLVFPMLAVGTGNFATGKSPADDAYYKDGAGSWTSLAIDDAASEIGSTGMYELDLVAAEVNHDQVVIKLTAASVDDLMIVINTVPTPAQLADGVAHGGTLGSSTATLALKHVNVTNSSNHAVQLSGSGSGLEIIGTGDNPALNINNSGIGNGCHITSNGGDTGGLVIAGANAGAGLILLGSESGPGLEIDGPYTTPGPALVITTDSGNYNGSVGGDAISLVSTDGQAITLSPEQWLTKLSTSAGTMVIGTVDNTAHTPTTTVFQADDITEANADQFFERLVIFTGGTLARQAREILSYSLVGGRGQFTLKTALTGAPANDDTFIVV